VPSDHPQANATTRRTFLVRGVAGGAVVATVAAAGLSGGLGTASVSAQAAPDDLMVNSDFAVFAAPLELAAVQAYQAALSGPSIDDEWTTNLRTFQSHHQEVATVLTSLIAVETPPIPDPVADPGVMADFSPDAGADQNAVLSQLSALETALAATHLSVIARLEDTSTAKTVSQVLATESQQAVALGRASGASIESLTPASVSTEGALTPTSAPTTETSGSAADASSTTAAN